MQGCKVTRVQECRDCKDAGKQRLQRCEGCKEAGAVRVQSARVQGYQDAGVARVQYCKSASVPMLNECKNVNDDKKQCIVKASRHFKDGKVARRQGCNGAR